MSKKQEDKNFIELSPLEAMHQTAKGLYDAGVVDAQTLHKFDVLCLPKVKDFSAKDIKNIRIREKTSQGVFAKYLNTSISTIKQWELGEKHPRGTSLKLLNLVDQKGIGILA
jgi:putative transcriptional regulator